MYAHYHIYLSRTHSVPEFADKIKKKIKQDQSELPMPGFVFDFEEPDIEEEAVEQDLDLDLGVEHGRPSPGHPNGDYYPNKNESR